ncbi:cupredoxin domain-containing protein [Kaarinaea lacus]
MKITHAIIIGVALAWITGISEAREHVVNQIDNKFSEVFLKVGSKDKIKIVNLDSVNHKISFLYKDEEQLVTELKPGGSQVIELNSPGIYDIKSPLHPEMSMTVYVPHVVKIGADRSEYYF